MQSPERSDGYDVIGDIHGYADKLLDLLNRLGYEQTNGTWRHPRRQAVFVGDLLDRGPRQVEVIRIVQSMVAAGTAYCIAGNHEFNAVAFHTPDPARPGQHLRAHSDKNLSQHAAFLDQVARWSNLHAEVVSWFRTLPLWFDQDGLRVIHACWDPAAFAELAPYLSDDLTLTKEGFVAASERDHPAWGAVEHLLKGPEVPIDPPYLDKGGAVRARARFRWWLAEADRLDVAAHIPSDARTPADDPYPPLPSDPIRPPVAPYQDATPVIYGHYWASGEPTVTSERTACVDYSAGKGGPLVAYRWSGEPSLTDSNFRSTPP